MAQAELFGLFTAPLDRAEIEYMVSGSVAGIVYGEPRLTNDVDLIVHFKANDAAKLVALFPAERFYCPPAEVIMLEARRPLRGHFNLIHHASGHKADVYVAGRDPLHTWGFAHRRRVDLADDLHLWVAPPEYVILRKLEYYVEGGSEKHRHDIAGMLHVSGDSLDRKTLLDWIQRRGLSEPWTSISAEVEGR